MKPSYVSSRAFGLAFGAVRYRGCSAVSRQQPADDKRDGFTRTQMLSSPSRRRSRLRARAAVAAVLAAAIVRGVQPAANAAEGDGAASITTFNIAAQPLTSALDAFSAATGMQIVYDGVLAQGRRSSAVVGATSPYDALRELLSGTGLVPVRGAGAFTVMPGVIAGARKQPLSALMPYLGAVQASIERAFCGSPETRPGSYDTKLQFWIGPSGQILRPHLLGATADPARDQVIMRVLGDLSIQRPPPPDLPQPIVITVSSRSPAESGDCAPERTGAPAQAKARHD
jgi:hypothetical protein